MACKHPWEIKQSSHAICLAHPLVISWFHVSSGPECATARGLNVRTCKWEICSGAVQRSCEVSPLFSAADGGHSALYLNFSEWHGFFVQRIYTLDSIIAWVQVRHSVGYPKWKLTWLWSNSNALCKVPLKWWVFIKLGRSSSFDIVTSVYYTTAELMGLGLPLNPTLVRNVHAILSLVFLARAPF